MQPSAAALLRFDPANAASEKLRHGLSAVVLAGHDLWTVSDETTSIERLTRVTGASKHAVEYAAHTSIPLDPMLRLPIAPDGRRGAETDIEALAIHDHALWIVGSHSVSRGKPLGRTSRERIAALAKTSAQGNRYLLARLPLSSVQTPSAIPGPASAPPSRLRASAKADDLTRLLRSDPHVGPFVGLPGKENGLDIEGLAVAGGGRVFLGLRGPVIGGYAVVIELRIAASRKASTQLKMKRLDAGGGDGAREILRKHFLDLGGLGIRDLCFDGADLIVLAGPTMNLDGPATLYRWPGALRARGSRIVEGDGLRRLLDLRCGDGDDHPEGVALWPPGAGAARQQAQSVLVVYEKPSPRRSVGASAVLADVFALPRKR